DRTVTGVQTCALPICAIATLDSHTYAGATPRRVAAFPGPVNFFSWRGLADMPDVVSIQDVDLLRGFDPSAGHLFYKPESSPAIRSEERRVGKECGSMM